VAQGVGRGIALLFHNSGTRRGWVVSSTPWPHFTLGKDPVPILQKAGWAPGSVWTGRKSYPHQDSTPNRPAHSQSLYQLSYPAHIVGLWSCQSSNSTVQSVPCQYNNTWQTRQCGRSNHNQNQVLSLLCAELHRIALSSVATRMHLTNRDSTKLTSESDSDAHLAESDSDIADTNFTQWTVSTTCRPTVPVVHRITGGPSGLRQTEPPHIKKDLSPLSVLTARHGRQAN